MSTTLNNMPRKEGEFDDRLNDIGHYQPPMGKGRYSWMRRLLTMLPIRKES